MADRFFRPLRPVRLAAVVLGLALVLAFTSTACSASAPASVSVGQAALAAGAATQTNTSGQVTVQVTWQGADAGPVFDVVMNTHSVDLDGVDLARLAVLRTDQGREASAQTWEAPKGGHHRSGKLVFAARLPDGSPLVGKETKAIELVIRSLAGVPERVFKWQL